MGLSADLSKLGTCVQTIHRRQKKRRKQTFVILQKTLTNMVAIMSKVIGIALLSLAEVVIHSFLTVVWLQLRQLATRQYRNDNRTVAQIHNVNAYIHSKSVIQWTFRSWAAVGSCLYSTNNVTSVTSTPPHTAVVLRTDYSEWAV